MKEKALYSLTDDMLFVKNLALRAVKIRQSDQKTQSDEEFEEARDLRVR